MHRSRPSSSKPTRSTAVKGLAALLLVLALSAGAPGRAGAAPPAKVAVAWSHVGDAGKAGTSSLNGAVYALNTSDPGVLFAGGSFTSAGGNPKASHLARWNGTTWAAVGSPSLNGDVHAIAYSPGKLIVGGVFTNAGGNPNLDFVAEWNGVKWGPVCASSGPLVTASVSALQIVGSTLYIGGSFANGAGIDSADYLLACNLTTGVASSTMQKDGDFSGAVYALAATSNGTLYAGGGFTNLGGVPGADDLAAYSGGSWHALGTGPGPNGGSIDDFVRSLTASGSNLYVGTDSKNIGGIAQADHVARWNGSAWSALGANKAGSDGWFPSTGFIYGLAHYGSLIFAAGSFQNAGGDPHADQIAYFDGTAWHALGANGANGPWVGYGLALATLGSKLYAGGNFTSAGGDTLAEGVASTPLAALHH